MRTTILKIRFVVLSALLGGCFQASGQVIDFENFTVSAATDPVKLADGSAWIGPLSEAEGTDVDDGFGATVRVGSIVSGGAQFINRHNLMWGSWSGFSISNRIDTGVIGWTPEPNVLTGSAYDGNNYAAAFGYLDSLDATDTTQLEQLPYFELPGDKQIVSARITNTTYSGKSMELGDSFAKKFGGETGEDPDFFRLSIYGSDAGVPLSESVEMYLADFRSDNKQDDYILNEWEHVDLSPLADADRLYFNLDSSDVGSFGMNTPSYFAIDAIELQDVENVVGDVTGDGMVSVSDVDAVCSAVAELSSDSAFDVNGDEVVGIDDVAELLSIANRMPGDADFNGEVGFVDFLTLSKNFGQAASYSGGDFDCDLEAQFSDFLVLSGNYGGSFASSVPEPSSSGTVLLGVLLIAMNIRRKRSSWRG